MFTNLDETLEFLYQQLPVFQNQGASALNYKLDKTRQLCLLYNNPQDQYKTIHVGGTNGKGSTSHMLASVLQEAGNKVGIYTSPHLKSFTERIKVNGQEVEEQFVVDFVNDILPKLKEIKPSFFEFTVIMAFEYFKQQKVDYAVIEVGMGGRLDSTNVITPEIAVITNVSLDHQKYLGDTVQEIAREKLGIAKENIPLVVGRRQEELISVYQEHCNTHHISYHYASNIIERFDTTNPFGGSYQIENERTVRATLQIAFPELDNEAINKGIAKTQLKGRWQKVNNIPLVIADTGHNYDAIINNIQQLKELGKPVHMILGFVEDKDVNGIFNLLPQSFTYSFVECNNQRSLKLNHFQELVNKYQLKGDFFLNVNDAYTKYVKKSINDSVIYIGGSTFVLADLEVL